MFKNPVYILLTFLLIISFVLRTYQLDKTPPSMYWDEMDVGYQAFSILKTGKDYFGQTPSLVMQSFADFRAPVLIYLTIPFVAIFDLTVTAVRLPSAIFGTINVLLFFILAKLLFKDSKKALLVATLSAVNPWSLQYSRIAFEATIMLSFFLGGLIAFLKALDRPKWYFLSAILFSVSVFTYNTAKLFVPLFILLLALIYIRKKNFNKSLFASFFIFAFIFTASLYSSIFLGGGQRFSEISIFSDSSVASKIDVLRHKSGVAHLQGATIGQKLSIPDKVTYNKISFLLDSLSRDYLQVFSSEFLFLKGDPNLRHSSGVGEFFRIEFITIILGFFWLLSGLRKGEKAGWFLLGWIILAPLSSIITKEGGNHATRLFFLFPALTLTSGLGLFFIWESLPEKLIKVPFRINMLVVSVIAGLWLFAAIFYLNHYFGVYRLESAKAFQYGFPQAAQIALANKNSYDYVIIDDRKDSALMNYIFEAKYDPALFQAQIHNLPYSLLQFPANKIDNVIMLKPEVKDWVNIFKENMIDNNYLLIVSNEQFQEDTIDKMPAKLTENQTLKDAIYYPDGSVAFYVIESKKPVYKFNEINL